MNSTLLPSERSDMSVLRSQLQLDLDNVMDYYNYRRMPQGYKFKQNGYRIPAEAHLQKNLTLNKKSASVKVLKSIRDDKEVQEICLLSMILDEAMTHTFTMILR